MLNNSFKQPISVIFETLTQFGIDTLEQAFSSAQYQNKAQDLFTKRITNDTRKVESGDIFCAVHGSEKDGTAYIEQAIQKGAALIIAQCKQQAHHGAVAWHAEKQVAIVQFYQLNHELFALASAYYQMPQSAIKVIGITGTNGKTSTSQIIASLLETMKVPCGLIGTMGAGRLNHLSALENTTPGATELLTLFAGFREQAIETVAMEVSSHALSQRRVSPELFDIAVFTNLSRDHLDYHKTMEAYGAAKFSIFTKKDNQVAIINGDDATAKKWLSTNKTNSSTIVYGRTINTEQCASNNIGFVVAKQISHHQCGVSFMLNSHLGNVQIESALLGDFNIDNLLAAIAVLLAQEFSLEHIANACKKLTAVNGRMECFSSKGKASVVVDYAHTPDALQNALSACRQHCNGDLWVVFGCGGDRDKGKRSIMGSIAEQTADQVIITNDNPRTESPELISKDILSGCEKPEKIKVMLDRQQAVLAALAQAKEKDMVLLAGKGHEDYIIIGDETLHYDERALVRSTFESEVLS